MAFLVSGFGRRMAVFFHGLFPGGILLFRAAVDNGLFCAVLSAEIARATLRGMKFRLLVEFDRQSQRWSAVFPELPGCASAGDSEAEAVQNAREALALWFEPSELKLKKNAKLLELALP